MSKSRLFNVPELPTWRIPTLRSCALYAMPSARRKTASPRRSRSVYPTLQLPPEKTDVEHYCNNAIKHTTKPMFWEPANVSLPVTVLICRALVK